MKTLRSKEGRTLALMLLLIAALVLMALPATGSHTCVEGSDDYDQCVASYAPPTDDTGTTPADTSDTTTWDDTDPRPDDTDPSTPECD